MNTNDIELPPMPEGMILEGIWAVTEDELIAYRDACINAAIEADRKHRFETGQALEQFQSCKGNEEPDPLERLRFYCSLAMSGQDWLDVEPFFDAIESDRIQREDQVNDDRDKLRAEIVALKGTIADLEADRKHRGSIVKKKDWNVELSSWSDEDFVQVFHERPDLVGRLRRVLAEPVNQRKPLTGEKIRIVWRETQARMGDGGDPVLWFARAIERAHGITDGTPPARRVVWRR